MGWDRVPASSSFSPEVQLVLSGLGIQGGSACYPGMVTRRIGLLLTTPSEPLPNVVLPLVIRRTGW